MSGWVDVFRKMWGWMSRSAAPGAIVTDYIDFTRTTEDNLDFVEDDH